MTNARWVWLAAAVFVSACGQATQEDVAAAPTDESVQLLIDEGREWEFLKLLNGLRASKGLGALSMNAPLRQIAREWSSTMATQNKLSHRPNLAGMVEARLTTQWAALGENVGVGGNVQALHDAFVASPAHYQNMVNGTYTTVGIGVELRGTTVGVTVNFMKANVAVATLTAPGARTPIGSFDVMQNVPEGERIAGWTLDPDTSASIGLHVYVDNVFAGAVTANQSRTDVATAYPGYGAAHGFDFRINVAPGIHNVCVYGINDGPGGNPAIACKTAWVPDNPWGAFDQVIMGWGYIVFKGWALDFQTTAPVAIHVYADGRWLGAATANTHRPDIGGFWPNYGASHGFDFWLPVSYRPKQVCVYAINVGAGNTNPLLGCKAP